MAGPVGLPMAALLLTHCLDTGINQAQLRLEAEPPTAAGSPLRLLCTFLGVDQITQVTWAHWGPNGSCEYLAVIQPSHGAYVPPTHRGLVRVTTVSAAGEVQLMVPGLDPPANGTCYCCKFSTFPSGVSERCLWVPSPEPAAEPSPAPQAWDRFILRPEVLGPLGAGAFFLLGSLVLLGHLLQARRHRRLVLSAPCTHTCSWQETPTAVMTQQGQPVQPTSFSAPYVLINLDYFTPQHRPTAPPLPPRHGRGQSQPARGALRREQPCPGHWPET
ncbi:transmembrane protein PVRIG [Carettochelys insculpta]|uniref:transmembrane protein PVRIG n=1 Tax=Carettochelys insculpta TaxID=44489 RepID=UPI003EBEFAC5